MKKLLIIFGLLFLPFLVIASKYSEYPYGTDAYSTGSNKIVPFVVDEQEQKIKMLNAIYLLGGIILLIFLIRFVWRRL